MTNAPSKYDGTFWDNKYWYPPALSWELVEKARAEGHTLAYPNDLKFVFPYIIAILIFRFLFERLIGIPFAKYCLGTLAHRRSPEECEKLEKLYINAKNKSTPENPFIPDGWTPARVARWYRRRRNMDRPDMVKKFSETSYRFFCYVFLWGYGLWALHDKIWVYDTVQCWVNFPFQDLDPEIYFYYLIELAFYCTLCISLFSDVRRKDFTEQIIHHIATITLITCSYCANFTRVGTLVIIIHDASDVWLEGAKLFVYCRKNKIADQLFTVFAIVFLVTRDLVYPYMVLHTTWVKSMWLYTPYFGYYAFNAFLFIIMILNLFWSFTILRMAYRMSKDDSGVENDDRSDAEEFSDDADDASNVVLSSAVEDKKDK